MAEHEVGVGDGRLRAAAAVTGGAGLGARALRADVEQAAVVEPRDRASARPDRVDVDRGQREPPPVEDAVELQQRLAAAHQRRVEARAAHVHRDAVAQAVRRELPQRGRGSRGRPREQRQRRALGDLGRRGHAAVRLHDQQRAAEPELLEAARERAQVARDDRSDVGVEHGRRGAVVVAQLRQQIARCGDVGVGQQRGDQVARAPLVAGLRRRVHERDRDRFDAFLRERRDRRADVVRVERRELVAAGADPPADGQPQVARDERLGRREAIVVGVLAPAVAQRERVAEAGGREQSGARAAAREHGVGRHRRAVHDQVELRDEAARREVEPRGELGQAGRDRARRVVRRAARLVHEPHVVADEEEVREGSADVDADPIAHGTPAARRRAVAPASTERPPAASTTP